jgi:uncharacterized protein YhfF
VDKTDATDAFWQRAKDAGANIGEDYYVRRIGGDPETTAIITDLVVKGLKRGTFGLQWLQERQPELRPDMDKDAMLINHDGVPQAIVKTTGLTPVPYGEITEEHLKVEGPGARELKRWQEIHWPYWTRLLEPHGLEPTQDMLVMVEHFDLVYPTAA